MLPSAVFSLTISSTWHQAGSVSGNQCHYPACQKMTWIYITLACKQIESFSTVTLLVANFMREFILLFSLRRTDPRTCYQPGYLPSPARVRWKCLCPALESQGPSLAKGSIPSSCLAPCSTVAVQSCGGFWCVTSLGTYFRKYLVVQTFRATKMLVTHWKEKCHFTFSPKTKELICGTPRLTSNNC